MPKTPREAMAFLWDTLIYLASNKYEGAEEVLLAYKRISMDLFGEVIILPERCPNKGNHVLP